MLRQGGYDLRVLSLFDGISCARVALGDRVTTYYASEIDKHAIAISQKNYPDIVRLGDVREVRAGSRSPLGVGGLTDIDLLIGGSPCQDLSIAKKDRKGLDGDRSGLFWEYVRVLREVKPKWFVLENVASMPKADKDTITRELGVEPVMLDAALVSAQSRKRLFWTNIPGVTQPADRGIVLKDILQPEAEIDESMVTKDGKAFCMTATYWNGGEGKWEYENNKAHKQRTMVKVGHIGATDGQANRVYSPEGKSVTLSANGGGSGAKTGLYAVGRDIGRRLDENGTRADGNEELPYQRRVELRTDNKSGTLTSVLKDNLVVETGSTRIRKLTPIECERLQGLPDNYTEGVAKTHRYKCLGNAFHVEVIKHILSFLRPEGFGLRPFKTESEPETGKDLS